MAIKWSLKTSQLSPSAYKSVRISVRAEISQGMTYLMLKEKEPGPKRSQILKCKKTSNLATLKQMTMKIFALMKTVLVLKNLEYNKFKSQALEILLSLEVQVLLDLTRSPIFKDQQYSTNTKEICKLKTNECTLQD